MTQVEIVKILIGTQSSLTDDDIQSLLDLNSANFDGTDQIYMASALACERLAADAANSAQQEKIGDYSVSFKNSDVSFQTQADRFRALVYETPAFAIAEQNLTSFSAWELVRNYILRTAQ